MVTVYCNGVRWLRCGTYQVTHQAYRTYCGLLEEAAAQQVVCLRYQEQRHRESVWFHAVPVAQLAAVLVTALRFPSQIPLFRGHRIGQARSQCLSCQLLRKGKP